MITLPKNPPNFEMISKAFPEVLKRRGVVYTYGGIVFNPDDGPIDECLGLHEACHSLQQEKLGKGAKGPDKWWKKFITDPKFRKEQELEAFAVQYRRYCELNSDRNKRASYLMKLAGNFASPVYGSVVTQQEAVQLIRYHAGVPA